MGGQVSRIGQVKLWSSAPRWLRMSIGGKQSQKQVPGGDLALLSPAASDSTKLLAVKQRIHIGSRQAGAQQPECLRAQCISLSR